MRRGFSLLGRVWVIGGEMGVRGVSKGCWLFKLLLVGFGDGVRCSRSLLCGLPPPTCLYSSLGADRIGLGLTLIVNDGEGGVGPVQSDGVVTVGEVLLGEDVEEEGGVVRSMIISAGLK